MKQTTLKVISWKPVHLLAGFVVFVVILSAVRNLFFPVVEAFGDAGSPKWKLVFGIPTFFVPDDFSGCIVFGSRIYPAALAINIVAYLVVAAVVSRLRLFRKA